MSFHPLMAYDAALPEVGAQDRATRAPPFTFTPERRAAAGRHADEVSARPEALGGARARSIWCRSSRAISPATACATSREILDMTPAEVEDVATYYVMFFQEPVGKYVLQVCRTLSCALLGAERVTEALSEKLGIKVGETDASGLFTLLEFECLGACDRAPIVMVNNEHWHETGAARGRGQAGGRYQGARARRRSAAVISTSNTDTRPPARTKRRGRQGRRPSREARNVRGVGPHAHWKKMDPILTNYVREPNSFTLDFFLKHQGYEGLRKALAMQPTALIDLVKASGLRGRGGAGFPTGLKWQFVLKDTPLPKYICCNADESEPGTFKDHVLMERNPHSALRGLPDRLLGDRREGRLHLYPRRVLPRAEGAGSGAGQGLRRRATSARTSCGSGFDCDIVIHRGAGAYEAGEETALIESLEGKRAQPRIKPPFPAASGLYNCPTAVNNVETLCNLPPIVMNGAEWFTSLGPEKNGGPKLFCVSGHVKRPGVYEAAMKTTLRELIYELRRRSVRRPEDQGGHSGRFVGADPPR